MHQDDLGGTAKKMATRKANCWKAIIKDAKSFVEVVLPKTKICFLYLSKEVIEAALTESQAKILRESVLGVTRIHLVHFIVPHADGTFTKMTTNEDGGTIHSLTECSMLSHKIEVSKNLAYKIDKFIIVKYEFVLSRGHSFSKWRWWWGQSYDSKWANLLEVVRQKWHYNIPMAYHQKDSSPNSCFKSWSIPNWWNELYKLFINGLVLIGISLFFSLITHNLIWHTFRKFCENKSVSDHRGKKGNHFQNYFEWLFL